MEPAVFLDRDNTLILNDGDLGDPDAVRLIDGVGAGLTALRDAGFRLVVVTNQGGVARGRYSEADVDAVHQRIAKLVEQNAGRRNLIDRFYYCPYHPEGTVQTYRRDHPWRKPHPGMLLQAARDMDLDLGRSWMIGNQSRDVQAGTSAGCRTVLLGGDTTAREESRPTAAVDSFDEAVQIILRDAQAHSSASGATATSIAAGGGRRHRAGGAMHDADLAMKLAVAVEPKPASASVDAPAAAPTPRPDAADRTQDALRDLIDELRSERRLRSEFTALRMVAGVAQLLAVLLALLGIMQIAETDVFVKWMFGAVLLQLMTIALLLVDARR